MTIFIYYINGDWIKLEHVEAIGLLGDRHLEIKCFDNEPVIHNKVDRFHVNDFHF